MNKVVVIGGGAAGMMSAIISAMNNNQVILIEKNEKLGKKIYITGKGRCNLINNTDCNGFLNNVVSNSKFLMSAIYSFTPHNAYEFFENLGLKLKTERGNRVFPLSDKASDVSKVLEKKLRELNVKILLNTCVKRIKADNGVVEGVVVNDDFIRCDSVIICTGGMSYSATGSTGDGYDFAKILGHTVIEPKSALVGIETSGNECLNMQGLSLKNVRLACYNEKKLVFSDFGEMLFTHFGISGPIALSCSSYINRLDLNNLRVSIDLKPALDYQTLDKRLINEFKENNNKTIINIMPSLLPKSMSQIILNRAQINVDKKCCEISKEERDRLINILKNFSFKVSGLRPIDEAIITSGGVNVKEINPKTMQSKICKGLYFAGEVIDVDALTGGFNLQTAFSTAYLAGNNA